MQSERYDVAVVGGGAVGLACGWRAAERGLRVVVLDAGEPGAWQVAAGMLAPVSEADYGERELLDLGLESLRRYEPFCAELAAASGRDPGLRRTGTLVVARDRDEAEALERLLAFRRGLGLEVERLRPTEARRREPALAPTVRLALDIAGDHAVDPRRLVAALAPALADAGGELRAGTRVRGLRTRGERVTGVELADGGAVAANAVVLAAGVHVARLEGVPDGARVPVRPVKGQVLRLRDPRGDRPDPPLVERTIRAGSAYLVPRGDGRYVLGATMEERGWDTTPTALGVYELLRDAAEVVPGVLELDLEEVRAGLRPATPDNLPAIGAGALEGLVWATGHFRNGILLTPVTAELVVAALAGERLPEWAAAADPLRFSGPGARSPSGRSLRESTPGVPA
jgi:glycine oxidase